jgi:hypothetical protein
LLGEFVSELFSLCTKEAAMMLCQYCTRPANIKKVVRDDWGRPRDVWLCDEHDPTNKTVNGSRKQYMEDKYDK